MSVYKEKLLDHLDKEVATLIPNQLERVGQVYNTVQGRYTLVGSVSGVGKTALVDDTMILKPYDWLTKTKSNIHFEGLYLSQERQVKYKLARFTSWKLFMEKGLRIGADTILGNNPYKKLTQEEKDLIRFFSPWMEQLLDVLDIKDGMKTVKQIEHEIELLRKKLGVLIKTDDFHLYMEDDKLLNVFHRKLNFGEHFKDSKRGKIPIIKFKYKNKSYEMEKNSVLYIPYNPEYLVLIIIDHIGKTRTDGYPTTKAALDALDAVLSNARDIYNFNPIAISQFNRSLSDPTRLKYSKGNLEPMYEDFKDTGNFVESADLILSVFDPYKYQSYDEKGIYKGYDIRNGMLTPDGNQRFRSLHILKHSYGTSNVSFGLKYTGESMHFSTLPRADDIKGLQGIYEQIIKEK